MSCRLAPWLAHRVDIQDGGSANLVPSTHALGRYGMQRRYVSGKKLVVKHGARAIVDEIRTGLKVRATAHNMSKQLGVNVDICLARHEEWRSYRAVIGEAYTVKDSSEHQGGQQEEC